MKGIKGDKILIQAIAQIRPEFLIGGKKNL